MKLRQQAVHGNADEKTTLPHIDTIYGIHLYWSPFLPTNYRFVIHGNVYGQRRKN